VLATELPPTAAYLWSKGTLVSCICNLFRYWILFMIACRIAEFNWTCAGCWIRKHRDLGSSIMHRAAFMLRGTTTSSMAPTTPTSMSIEASSSPPANQFVQTSRMVYAMWTPASMCVFPSCCSVSTLAGQSLMDLSDGVPVAFVQVEHTPLDTTANWEWRCCWTGHVGNKDRRQGNVKYRRLSVDRKNYLFSCFLIR
jgi:hypothetical protein